MQNIEGKEDDVRLQKLNYSEKLFLSRSLERKKKIDLAFNSISDTNNQQQITQALKLVTDVNERKELISKIIKRKKEIQEMKEINTINSLAPLFAKIKQKFFNNLYKKTGNQSHFVQSQSKNSSQDNSQNSIKKTLNEIEVDTNQVEQDNSKLDEQFLSSQTPPVNAPVNTPLIDQLNVSKKQHLFNALTLLATRSETKKKTGIFSQQQGKNVPSVGSNHQLDENKLKYLTRDPNIFKAELQYNKDHKKINERSNFIDTQSNDLDGDEKKQIKSLSCQSKVKAKIDNKQTPKEYKNQILTNYTSLQNILNYKSTNKKRTAFLSSKTQCQSIYESQNKSKQSQHFNSKTTNEYDENKELEQNDNQQINKELLYSDKQTQKKGNSILKKYPSKSYENSFAVNDFFSEEDKKFDSNDGSVLGTMLKNRNNSFIKKKQSLDFGSIDQNQLIKGLPKVNNFGGHYYYLGKKLPESHLYRFIVQCEQKRIYQKTDGNLFSNKPFTYDLDSLNQISHVHKIVDPESNQVDILELKHYGSPKQNTLKNSASFQLKPVSTPTSTKNQNKGLPILYTNTFQTSRRQADVSGNFSNKAKYGMNNTKDTDSLFSQQISDTMKCNIMQGFYTPKTKVQNTQLKWKNQFFVKINSED